MTNAIATTKDETMKTATTISELFAALKSDLQDSFTIDNEFLPERYHDNRSGSSSIERLNKIYNRDVLASVEHRELKAEKARRVELYRAQVDAQCSAFVTGREDVTITMDVNDNKLYRNECVFVNSMVSAGVITADSLEE